MRVAHIITGLSTGGAERALHNVLAGGLADRYHSAVVSLSDKGTFGERIQALGVPVHALGVCGGLAGPRALARLLRFVREFKPDLIQGWMYHGNLAASVAACASPGHPLVVWNIRHSLYALKREKVLTRQVIRAGRRLSSRPDAVLYNSKLSRKQHEEFGFSKSRGRVIPNGFDLKKLGPDELIWGKVRREFGIPEGAPVVGHVARFHHMKDHATFLRAAVTVAERCPTAQFLIVGRNVTPENPKLSGIVPSGLMPRFHFPGERPDAQELIRTMDLLCMSSAWGDAFPNVVGEAMACGVPCVATNVGDSADIVHDAGLIVPPSDPKALAEGMLTLLEKPARERKELGEIARSRIKAYYEIDAVVEQYAQVYETLLNQKNGS